MSALIEIQNQIALLQKQANEIRSFELTQTIQEILSKMEAYGITLDDLERIKGRPRKHSVSNKSVNPAPVKYRGPNGETWSGRGLMPKWLRALTDQGQSKESYLIQVQTSPE